MAELSMDAYWQSPPITRTIATATFVLSCGVHFSLIPGEYFPFDLPYLVRMPPQIWRFATCFLITFPQLAILFDSFNMYIHLRSLEKNHPRLGKREDLVWYLIFVCSTILILCHLTGFKFGIYTQALIMANAYTATQEQRGQQTNYMFFNIPSQMVPLAMMAINLFFPGGVMIVLMQLHGLVAAHLYLFLTKIWPDIAGGRNLIPTPAIVRSLVQRFSDEPQRGFVAGRQQQGQGQQPPSAASSGRSTGFGPLPDSWRARGPGHRLG